jgi:hypothetical protein
MPLDVQRAGINSVVEYQASALPWVTSSTASTAVTEYNLPKVTKFVTVTNHGSSSQQLRLGFTRNGVSGVSSQQYYYMIDGGQALTFDVRVKALYVRADGGTISYSLMCGLTTIDSNLMPTLSGTLPSGDSGWAGVGLKL